MRRINSNKCPPTFCQRGQDSNSRDPCSDNLQEREDFQRAKCQDESSSYSSSQCNPGPSCSDPCGGMKPLAIDCEMVRVDDSKNALGRVSVVDYYGNVVYDSLCKPEGNITNPLTRITGLTRKELKCAPPFKKVRRDVERILKVSEISLFKTGLFQNRVVVGHAVSNDFKALDIDHPIEDIRDTAETDFAKKKAGFNTTQQVSLKRLSAALLKKDIQCHYHDSVEDARTTMEIYKLVEEDFEKAAQAAKAAKAAKAAEAAKAAKDPNAAWTCKL